MNGQVDYTSCDGPQRERKLIAVLAKFHTHRKHYVFLVGHRLAGGELRKVLLSEDHVIFTFVLFIRVTRLLQTNCKILQFLILLQNLYSLA